MLLTHKPRKELTQDMQFTSELFGRKLKVMRLLLGMSIADAAEGFDISESGYKRLEAKSDVYRASSIQKFLMLELSVGDMAAQYNKTHHDIINDALEFINQEEAAGKTVLSLTKFIVKYR